MADVRREPRKVSKTLFWPTAYDTGMWAFVLHRFTGLILVAYFFLHLWVISSATVSGASFNEAMRFVQQPIFILLDVGLAAAVVFHGLNGVRILLFDMGLGVRQQKPLFWAVFAITALIALFTLVEVLPYVLGKPLI